jgi:hypothetical protein
LSGPAIESSVPNLTLYHVHCRRRGLHLADWLPFLAITTPKRIDSFRTRIARGRECLLAWRGEPPVGFT